MRQRSNLNMEAGSWPKVSTQAGPCLESIGWIGLKPILTLELKVDATAMVTHWEDPLRDRMRQPLEREVWRVFKNEVMKEALIDEAY